MALITQRTTPAAGDADWIEVAHRLADQIADGADAHDRSGAFVEPSIALLRAEGVLAAPVPAELGGGGASHAETCEMLRILGRACGSTAVTLSMHDHLVATQVWRYRHDLPAEAVLRRVAAEDLMLISTGASDWVDSSGTAVAVDGGFRVSGRKAPASGCPAGDVLVTSIRREDGPDGPTVIHCSIPFSADGVSIEETWDTLGLRGTGSHTVVLDDVFVPEAAVALERPAGAWHPVWNAVLGTALPLIMSAYLGIADAAVDAATEIARRKADAPHVPALVGQMRNHLATAEDAVGAMIANADDLRFDNTDEVAAFALTRKTIAADAVEATARSAVEVAGGLGFSRTNPLERLLRDAMGGGFHPLPPAKQTRFCGRLALGLDPTG